MLRKLWTSLKRATVGEKLEEVGRARGEWGARADVDIRRVSDERTFVTLSVTSNITVEVNGRTTAYAYLDDNAVEQLAADLTRSIAQRKAVR